MSRIHAWSPIKGVLLCSLTFNSQQVLFCVPWGLLLEKLSQSHLLIWTLTIVCLWCHYVGLHTPQPQGCKNMAYQEIIGYSLIFIAIAVYQRKGCALPLYRGKQKGVLAYPHSWTYHLGQCGHIQQGGIHVTLNYLLSLWSSGRIQICVIKKPVTWKFPAKSGFKVIELARYHVDERRELSHRMLEILKNQFAEKKIWKKFTYSIYQF